MGKCLSEALCMVLPTEGVPCWPWGAAGLWRSWKAEGAWRESGLEAGSKPFLPWCLCSPLYWQRWQRENYVKAPGPFSQSGQKGINLELRGNTLITSTGSDVSRNVFGCPSCILSDAFLHTFADVELTDKKVGTICSPERHESCPPMTWYGGASGSSHLVNAGYLHPFSFSFLVYILCPF